MYNFTGRNIQMHIIHPAPYWADCYLLKEMHITLICMKMNIRAKVLTASRPVNIRSSPTHHCTDMYRFR